MSEGLLLMSERERDRAHVVRQAMECGLSQQEAAERLGIGVRQFKRLVRAWKQNGASGRGHSNFALRGHSGFAVTPRRPPLPRLVRCNILIGCSI